MNKLKIVDIEGNKYLFLNGEPLNSIIEYKLIDYAKHSGTKAIRERKLHFKTDLEEKEVEIDDLEYSTMNFKDSTNKETIEELS